jgi:hypothetical protein
MKKVASKAHKSFAFNRDEYGVTISFRDKEYSNDLVTITNDEDLQFFVVEKEVKELFVRFDEIGISRHKFVQPFQSFPQLISNNGLFFLLFLFFSFLF